MESYADVGCVLKVNIHCEACKMKLLEVLRSISGVYSVTIDAEEGLAKITGEMDPNVLLWALARSGKHAEVKWVNLKSLAPKKSHHNYTNGGGYGALTDHHQPCRSRRPPLPEGMWHDTNQSYCPQWRHAAEYPSYYNTSAYGNGGGGYLLPPQNGAYYSYNDPFRYFNTTY